MKKLMIRILILLITIGLINFGMQFVLKIKHSDKEKVEDVWGWQQEHNNYFNLLHEKYVTSGEDMKRNNLILMKNIEVPKKENDEKRILVVGDSFIYGTGSNNVNYLWWKQLHLRFKEAGYSNVNVYGAGVPGFNTKEELERIIQNEELINNVEPDLIIIGYVVNDAEEHDEEGQPIINGDFEIAKANSELYKTKPNIYYELVDRLFALEDNKYDELIELGNVIGAHRWDALYLYTVQGERLERYRGELADVASYMKEINIPYFFAFQYVGKNEIIDEATTIIQTEMNNLGIEYYEPFYDYEGLLKDLGVTDMDYLNINPADGGHPGIASTYDYSKKIFEYLKNEQNFIFENPKFENFDDLYLNINDTMPILNITKTAQNTFEFEYPKKEDVKDIWSNFLYLPIGKNYVKLNLEYPKNIKEIKITGANLKDVEIYVNTIDEKRGFDYDEVFKRLTSCKEIKSGIFKVNKKITSVNIVAEFNDEQDRNLKIEFVE